MTFRSTYQACRVTFPRFTRPLYAARPRTPYLRLSITQPVRCQHDGPHKEYFQTPGQMPAPDISGAPLQSPALAASVPFVKRTRVRESLFIVNLILGSYIGGFMLGGGLVTWAYLQGPYKAGTEEEHEMMDEVAEMMNEHSSMQEVLNNPEWVEWPAAPRMVSGEMGKGLHLVTGTLTGSKGIIQRIFYNHRLKMLHVVVYFGNGVEGWPDVVHGGVVTTMLKEAMEKLAPEVLSPTTTTEMSDMGIQFYAKIAPGEVYTIYAFQAGVVESRPGESAGIQAGMQRDQQKNSLIALVMAQETAGGIIGPTSKSRVLGYGTFRERTPAQEDENVETP